MIKMTTYIYTHRAKWINKCRDRNKAKEKKVEKDRKEDGDAFPVLQYDILETFTLFDELLYCNHYRFIIFQTQF